MASTPSSRKLQSQGKELNGVSITAKAIRSHLVTLAEWPVCTWMQWIDHKCPNQKWQSSGELLLSTRSKKPACGCSSSTKKAPTVWSEVLERIPCFHPFNENTTSWHNWPLGHKVRCNLLVEPLGHDRAQVKPTKTTDMGGVVDLSWQLSTFNLEQKEGLEQRWDCHDCAVTHSAKNQANTKLTLTAETGVLCCFLQRVDHQWFFQHLEFGFPASF